MKTLSRLSHSSSSLLCPIDGATEENDLRRRQVYFASDLSGGFDKEGDCFCDCSSGMTKSLRYQVAFLLVVVEGSRVVKLTREFKDQADSEMGGFTRILHSGKADGFMDEIPTFIAQPLPPGVDQGYIVLNRPWAFVQWLQQADIKEDYILMAEPDHIIVKPIPNLSNDGFGAAFPFFYIEPKKYESALRKFFPVEKGPITNIDPIGNSPVIVGKESLKRIAPTWMNVSLEMKKDPEADKSFGWVLEMYAYAVASALHDVRNILHKEFMIQPPWDKEIGKAYIIHYTYGCDYDLQGNLTYGRIGEWRFDKRSYDNSWPPRNLSLPPPGVPDSVVTLVKMVNEATANLPNWGS